MGLSPSATVAAVALQARVATEVFAAHSLKVNLKAGKTEAALALRGPSSKHIRATIADEGGIRIGIK